MTRRWIVARIGAVSIFSIVTLGGMPGAQGQSASNSATPAEMEHKIRLRRPRMRRAAPRLSANGQTTNPQSQYQMQDQSGPAGDSLAEAARKAKAQKPKTVAPRVYTDDSVTHLSDMEFRWWATAARARRRSGMRARWRRLTAARELRRRSEQANNIGAGGQKQIRDQMAQIDRQIAGLREEIAKQGAVSVDPQSGLQSGVIYITDRNAQIKELEGRKDGLQKQMDALEDEGRKDGADAGGSAEAER